MDITKSAGATLRIYTLEGSLDFISEALQATATGETYRGEPVYWGNPAGQRRDESCWNYTSPLSDHCPLDEHLSHIAAVLRPRIAELTLMRTRLTAMNVFCKFSSENGQGSACLRPDILSFFGGLGMEIILDLYPPSWD